MAEQGCGGGRLVFVAEGGKMLARYTVGLAPAAIYLQGTRHVRVWVRDGERGVGYCLPLLVLVSPLRPVESSSCNKSQLTRRDDASQR
jgi:hypothetical protein